jgi:hypothetical protein
LRTTPGDRRVLLADGDVDALNAGALLVDDRVDGDGGLAGLAVADDQLTLATADRHHRVDGLQTGLHRLVDRLAGDDARRDLLDRRPSLGLIGPCRRSGCPARRRRDPAAGPTGTSRIRPVHLTGVAFFEMLVVTQDHGTHRVALQVQCQAEGVARELEHLVVLASARPWMRTIPSGQRFGKTVQSTTHRTVNDGITGTQDDTANERLVDLSSNGDFAIQTFLERVCQLGLLLAIQLVG